MSERVAVWAYFDDADRPVIVRTPYAEAVAEQRAIAEARGHTYATDDEAFDDFVVVSWAQVEPAPV
jgi:hypothetical protein